MAKNALATFAASTDYAVWTAPLGTPLPTSIQTSAQLVTAGFYEVGLLSDDGISESRDVNDNLIYDLLGSLIRNVRNQEQRSFGFTAQEDNRVVRELKYVGSVLTTTPGTAEVQTATITGSPTGGTFTLSGGSGGTATTAPLAYNASSSAVQTALQALPGFSGVTVSGSAGGPYTITFPAALGNVAQLTANGAALTGGTTPAVATATTTGGVAATNSRALGPGTGLNSRVWYIGAVDGVKAQAFTMGNAEASATGESTISGGAIKTTQFSVRAYLDSNNKYFYLLDNDPAQAVAYA